MIGGISIWALFILEKQGCPSMKEVVCTSLMSCSYGLGAVYFLCGIGAFVMAAGRSGGRKVGKELFCHAKFMGLPGGPCTPPLLS